MSLSYRNTFPLALIALGVLAIHPANAQVTIGATNQQNTAPFGTQDATATTLNYAGEYQQVYSGGAFPTAGLITGIAFSSSSNAAFNQAEDATYVITVRALTTSTAFDASRTTFLSTTGATTVFNTTLNTHLNANNTFDLNIPFSTPFLFTPTLGSLLLDINIQSAVSFVSTDPNAFGVTNFFQAGNTSTSTYRVYYTGGVASGNPATNIKSDRDGLLTRFSITPAPEPSPAVILLLGFGGVTALAAGGRLSAKRRA